MPIEIRLITIKLRNFKGIRNFELLANGENVDIYGDNATGKTTIYDAFTWLLLDKDSQGKKDFDIKTLDANNKSITGLDHEVEGVLSINGKPLKLRKVYSENWTKKRGSADLEFTGHTTDYYVDDVPVKAKEYNAKIAEIVSEDLFKLLTNPMYFNEDKLFPWQKRRDVLMKIGGRDLSDEEVIASNKALAELTTILNGRKLDDHRKIVKARQSIVNEEKEKIPVRIDEATRSIPIMPEQNEEQIAAEIERLTVEVASRNQELADLKNGGLISAKRKELLDLELAITRKQNERQTQIDQAQTVINNQKNEYRQKILDVNGDICAAQRMVANIKNDLAVKQKAREDKRAQWHAVNDQIFVITQDEVCPTCGQAIPAEMLQSARESALAEFNRVKAEKLERITEEGFSLKNEVEELEKQITGEETKIKELTQKMTNLERERDAIPAPKEPAPDSELEALTLKKQTLSAEIAHFETGSAGTMEQITGAIAELNYKIQGLRADLLKFELKTKTETRIAELKRQERELAKEYERLEKELFLTEEFIRTKVKMLEDSISSKFKYARFKMFDQQINGGLTECCESLYNGVPHSSGLNTGHRVIVGLDIINTLSEFYGFKVPIFIDERQSVTEIPLMKSQIINLFVSKPDKKLRIEMAGKGLEQEVG
jgi:DNA repair exonuclease SbcCD ATPase subunit